MKKLLIYGTAIVMCVAAGCKKDNNNNNKITKTYLVKQQITDDSVDGIPIDTANYTYDDQNRVTTVTDGSGQNKITYTMTYDGQGRVTTSKRFDYMGNLVIEYDFFYGNNTGYYFSGPSHPADTANFLFNNQHQVTEIDTKHSGRTTFLYDTRGNVAQTQLYDIDNLNKLVNEDSYAYDNMKNPFSQIPSGNLFLEYVVFIHSPSTLINNIADKDGDPFAYTYNSDGFPENVVITLLNNNQEKIHFNYFVK